MKLTQLKTLLKDLAFTRTGGSAEEHIFADLLEEYCRDLGFVAKKEVFPIDHPAKTNARLELKEKTFPALSYIGFGKQEAQGELFILHKRTDEYYKSCRGKIVLLDGAIGYSTYEKLIENGACGFICFFGSVNDKTKDIFPRRRRFNWEDKLIPGISIHAKDAARLSFSEGERIKISSDYTMEPSYGVNLICNIQGETEKEVVLCAHYDSTEHSKGVFDNLSGTLALLHVLEALKDTKPHRNIKFIWTACEELGLVGSEHYCKSHKEQLKNVSLCINLDMLGASIGSFTSFSSINEKTVDLLDDFARKMNFPNETRLGIRSSDSTVFTDYAVPTVSFARYAPSGIACVHTPSDDLLAVNPKILLKDMEYVKAFTEYAASSEFPVQGEICQKVREDTEKYFLNKIRP